MKELAEQLGEYISAPIYKTYIRSAVVVEEAQANSQDIFDYANKSTVAEDVYKRQPPQRMVRCSWIGKAAVDAGSKP